MKRPPDLLYNAAERVQHVLCSIYNMMFAMLLLGCLLIGGLGVLNDLVADRSVHVSITCYVLFYRVERKLVEENVGVEGRKRVHKL